MVKIYSAKVGTQPMLIQLRHRYALLEGDRVLYRQVTPSGLAIEQWQHGLVDEEYPYPHNSRNLLWLSRF